MLQKATAAATAEAADAAFCGAVASKPHPFACLAPDRAEEAGNDTNIDKAAFAAEAATTAPMSLCVGDGLCRPCTTACS